MFEFYPDTVEVVRKEVNLDQPGRIDEAVDLLEQWIKMQKHFTKKDFSRKYLETILVLAKGSLERAKQRMDRLCTYRTLMPQFFPNNITKDTFAHMNDYFVQLHLPKLTKEHYRIFFCKLVNDNFDPSFGQIFMINVILMIENLIINDYSGGLVAICDYRDVNILNVLKKINLIDLKHLTTLSTEGYGMRLKGIHLISNSNTINSLISILKQILSAKVGGRIHVHKNLDTLHEVIDKDILPEDYGGKEKPLRTLRDKYFDMLCSEDQLEIFRKMYEAKTDETRREAADFNEFYLGTPGSFRTLSVD